MSEILLIAGDEALPALLRPALQRLGVGVEVHLLASELEDGARLLFAEPDDGSRLVVCDCAGERGCERGFFVSRAAAGDQVVLLAVGDTAEPEPVATLLAALVKALPAARVAMVTDRVGEESRPSGGAMRAPWTADRLAEILRDIATDPRWRHGQCFRL